MGGRFGKEVREWSNYIIISKLKVLKIKPPPPPQQSGLVNLTLGPMFYLYNSVQYFAKRVLIFCILIDSLMIF